MAELSAETAQVAGYTRDRSFYASRPGGGGVKVHRESTTAPGMAACNTRWVLLHLDSKWDVAATRRDCPSILCRRCFPPGERR